VKDSSQLACGRQNCEATTCLNENTGGMTSCTLTADDENLSLVCGITADSATTTVEGPDQMEGTGKNVRITNQQVMSQLKLSVTCCLAWSPKK
jgi:hypothetical protein